jgi:hypothetical protein
MELEQHRKKKTDHWYAKLYGIPLQTIQRARRRGWSLKDPAKLLEKMLAANGPKATLTTLRAIVDGKSLPAKASLPVSEPVETSEHAAFSEAMVLRSGLLHELKRLQEETMESYRSYITEKRAGEKMILQKIYLNNVAALRMLAKEAPKAEREAGNVLVVADVEATWARGMKEFKTTLETLGRRLATDTLFHTLNPVDVEQLVNKEIAAVLATLETATIGL